jgi:hypothetical protein
VGKFTNHILGTGSSEAQAQSKTWAVGHIQAEDGRIYNVGTARVLENHSKSNDPTTRMPDNRPVLFRPHPGGRDGGQIVYPWADKVYLLPYETRLNKQELGLPSEKLKLISVFIVLRAKGTGHIYDSDFVSAKLRFVALGATKISELLGGVKRWIPDHVPDIWDLRYVRVPYKNIAPNAKNRWWMVQSGRSYKDQGLPWHQIGVGGRSNPGVTISADQTLDQSVVEEEDTGTICCQAFKRGNGLTAYSNQSNKKEFIAEALIDLFF